MLRLVASSWASFRAAPSSRKLTRLRSVAPSQPGRGKLPMVVVAMGGSCIASPLRIFFGYICANGERQVVSPDDLVERLQSRKFVGGHSISLTNCIMRCAGTGSLYWL